MNHTQASRAFRYLRAAVLCTSQHGNRVRHVQEPGYDRVRYPGTGYDLSHSYVTADRAVGDDGSARIIVSRRRDGRLIVSYSRAHNTPLPDEPAEYTVVVQPGRATLRVMSRRGEHVHHDQLVPSRNLLKLLRRLVHAFEANSQVDLRWLDLRVIPGQSYVRGLRTSEYNDLEAARASQLREAADAVLRAARALRIVRRAEQSAG